MTSLGDDAQIRLITEQVAEALLVRMAERIDEKLHLKEAAIPAPLKWAGAIIAGLFTAGTAALAFWIVSSVSQMQVTLARMDERIASGAIKDARYDGLERRVGTLERYHQGGGS